MAQLLLLECIQAPFVGSVDNRVLALMRCPTATKF